MNGNQEFLQQLRATWNNNPVIATLVARMQPMRIPAETMQMAVGMQQSFQNQTAIDDAVNAGMGSLGIFGGGGQNFGFGGYNPDDMMFYGTMGLIRTYNGDPPASRALVEHAESIINGQLDPLQAFALASKVPEYVQIFQMMAPFIGDMGPILRQQGLIQAAMAVPREDIARLLGIDEELTYDDEDEADQSLDDIFEKAMQVAEGAIESGKFEVAEEQLVAALQASMETPTPNDDIQALDRMCLLAFKAPVDPGSISLCFQVLDALSESGSLPEQLSRIAVTLAVISNSYGLNAEHDASIIRIGQSLLGKSIPKKQRLPLTLATAAALLRQGESADAQDLIDAVRERYHSPNDLLDIAAVESDIYWDNGDNDGATDILTEAVKAGEKGDVAKRIGVLQKLISVWPEGREGLDPWLEEFKASANSLEEPHGTLALITILLALIRGGKKDRAKDLAAQLDFDELAQSVPKPMQDMVRLIRQSLDAIV